MTITYNLPEMTEAEWDAHCAKVASEQLAIWQAKQARKTSVMQMLNVGIRPCVAVKAVA